MSSLEPVMKSRSLKDGSTWYIALRGRTGRDEHVDSFQSETKIPVGD
jgi:hypothetical protein